MAVEGDLLEGARLPLKLESHLQDHLLTIQTGSSKLRLKLSPNIQEILKVNLAGEPGLAVNCLNLTGVVVVVVAKMEIRPNLVSVIPRDLRIPLQEADVVEGNAETEVLLVKKCPSRVRMKIWRLG